MGDISKNFSLNEFEHSDTAESRGIDNTIKDSKIKSNVEALVKKVLQPLRDEYGPIRINSGYRCKQLNELVGGAPTSMHSYGMAADCGVKDPYLLATIAIFLNLPFDQCILYPTFVHFSHVSDRENRRQVMYSSSWKGKRDL